jgi:uncharacterized protein (TIGR02611 family)
MRLDDTQQMNANHTREMPRVTAVKQTRRVLVLVLGAALMLAGLVLIIFPGPFSIPLFLLGLSVLSWEFPWAKRVLFQVKHKIKAFTQARRNRNRPR